MPSSFISEHTAEYVLVPQIIKELNKHFEFAIPVFYWTTREGGLLARESIADYSFRLIALYARRPKLKTIGDEEIHIRIIKLLVSRAAAFKDKSVLCFSPKKIKLFKFW